MQLSNKKKRKKIYVQAMKTIMETPTVMAKRL